MRRMTQTHLERLLSVAEVAVLLGVSRSLVVRKAGSGELPHSQRVGSGRTAAYLFRRADVEQYAVAHLPVPPIHQQPAFDDPVPA
jgi:excisionase family DNA binding protein